MKELNKFQKHVFEKHLSFLLSLRNVKNKKQRAALIKNMSKAQLNAVRNFVHEFLKSYVVKDKKLNKKFEKNKNLIYTLSQPVSAKNIEKKKTVIQSGGFLPLLPLLASVVPGLGKIFK